MAEAPASVPGGRLSARGVHCLLLPGLFVLLAAAYGYVHCLASYTLPVPWPDEASFLWPAIAFARDNTLFAPQLNPTRPLLWMPPGYMLVLGAIFKVVGFSFGLARALSLGFMLGAFVLLFRMTQKHGQRLAALAFLGVFMLHPSVVVVGNVARMESLLLLGVCAGFLLLEGGRLFPGMAVLALLPLIHPNGVYFVLGGLALGVYRHRCHRARWRPGRAGLILGAVALAAWAGYLLYVAFHWDAFLTDMAYQLRRKSRQELLSALGSRKTIGLAAAAVLCLVYGLASRLPAVWALFLGIPALAARTLGHEMWYRLFESLFLLMLAVAALHALLHAASAVQKWKPAYVRPICNVAAVVLILAGLWRCDQLEGVVRLPRQMQWAGMGISDGPGYITRADIEKVRSFLRSVASEESARLRLKEGPRPTTVEIWPQADSLFFHDMDGPALRLACPTFHTARPDACIIHVSRYKASWADQRLGSAFRKAGIDPDADRDILHERDGTEKWYARSYLPFPIANRQAEGTR